MDFQQRTILIVVTIFVCYTILMMNYYHGDRDNGHSAEFIDEILSFELTQYHDTLNKAGRQFWDSIEPKFKCPADQLSRPGAAADGGKWTCGLNYLGLLTESVKNFNCLVYSFGVNRDSSFEAGVLMNTRCTVYAYDMTVNQIGKPLNSSNPRVHFFKLGIGGENKGNIKTLKTLMGENGGHEWIDILKMDVEGAEFESLARVFEDFPGELPFGQLLVEVHGNGKGKKWEKIVELFKKLEERGMRLFYKEINPHVPDICSEFSFINTRKYLDRFLDLGEFKKEVDKIVPGFVRT